MRSEQNSPINSIKCYFVCNIRSKQHDTTGICWVFFSLDIFFLCYFVQFFSRFFVSRKSSDESNGIVFVVVIVAIVADLLLSDLNYTSTPSIVHLVSM